MADLKTFLRRQNKKLLDSSIQQLRAGITCRLTKKYTPLYGEEKAGQLGSALLNRCLLEEPVDMAGKIFYQSHTDLIESELVKLQEDDSLGKALSYLFATETLYNVRAAQKSAKKHSQELTEQADRLGIHIPDIKEICRSSDMNECVIEIIKYAADFYMDNCRQSDNTD